MTWRPQYRSSKFRHVFGKAATKENCYDGVPITRSVHDNHFCAVNPRFIAVITECAGGGAFLVISINHTGKVDPHHPKVSGHRGNVMDVKWNPFNDYCIASCSEDTTVKIWDIPKHGVLKNITVPRKELQGHSRRAGLIEWHPTANNVLFSTGYDYKVMVWNLDSPEQVIKNPVKTISLHTDVVLSMSFNTDGSLMATSCKDKKIRVIDPRTGTLLQVANSKLHKANKVLFLGNLKMLLSTGNSRWNQRQIALWDQEDLSVPLLEEDLDGSSGVLFPFYDPDTHMLYIAGKGDGNIRYYEISSEKPYIQFLTEYRSLLPQKGMGIMPKRGLDVSSCEVFRFYRLVTIKSLIEPLAMIVPRRSESYQEDIYPMTAGCEPALMAEEWLSGMDKGPVLMSLKPGAKPPDAYPGSTEGKDQSGVPNPQRSQSRPDRLELSYIRGNLDTKESKMPDALGDLKSRTEDKVQDKVVTGVSNGCDLLQCSPPKTENELLQTFYRQQEEIRRLRELLGQRDVRIKQLELEIKNVRNSRGPY
ncbi:coronin-2A [Scleropages formosus]|uniref:Coronin n=1 Tax=Scleropages formosus TaxID=113540 RepID=A0A8C9S1K8_SCLFO|nr:coronin-2A [Scleropages formosus]XP_018591482.1 coronin-2A [Scleropages formosus]XP_018591483.1 coronin-2A [Scleropages formosus]XP_018591484.1 coronin-2A [Scleropages formosus]